MGYENDLTLCYVEKKGFMTTSKFDSKEFYYVRTYFVEVIIIRYVKVI